MSGLSKFKIIHKETGEYGTVCFESINGNWFLDDFYTFEGIKKDVIFKEETRNYYKEYE